MKFSVVTLFPEFFDSPLRAGLMGKAVDGGLVELDLVDLREFGLGKHQTTDDYPFGGGAGMVMKPEPAVAALEEAKRRAPASRTVMMTPQGTPFTQLSAERFATLEGVIFLCGRYEGFDERIRGYVDEEVSLGDFVLMGGEVAALTMIEATTRLLPGVLGDEHSAVDESMSSGLLEYPQYTRPREFRGDEVPEVLIGGNHGEIERWRREMAIRRTAERRPDLLARAELTTEEAGLADRLLAKDGIG